MNTAEKILTLSQAQALRQEWKNNQQKVVFTNGCFDILHLGHVDYLEKARATGDKLIIGLNSDASVKRLKGETRPVNGLYARARLLAALSFVDAVVSFEQDTPLELIGELVPDILIKGSDYQVSNIVGADIVMSNGGQVLTIDLVNGYSTSNIIEKIKH